MEMKKGQVKEKVERERAKKERAYLCVSPSLSGVA
jgi:hypothetical protein